MKNRTLIRVKGARRWSVQASVRRGATWSLPFLLLVSLLLTPSSGSDIPEWPHEQEERLSVVESKLLDVQRKLFVARATNDEQKRIELEKQMKELEGEQVKLLRATGQFPPR